MKNDEYFGDMEVYLDSFIAQLAIARATPEAMELEIELGYQGCAEGGLCYMPQTRFLTVKLPEATTVGSLPTVETPVSEQAFLADVLVNRSIWNAIGIFFLAGLALALTPCVLPMIPILSGIIAGEGDKVTPMRGFTLALSYVLGMAIVYTGAGVAAAAAGMQLACLSYWRLACSASSSCRCRAVSRPGLPTSAASRKAARWWARLSWVGFPH
jgi:thiol:disulfide interchange protein DsbD